MGVRNSRNESAGHARIFHREERNRKQRTVKREGRPWNGGGGKRISPTSSKAHRGELEHIPTTDALIVRHSRGNQSFSLSSFFLSSFFPSFPSTSHSSCTYLHRNCSFQASKKSRSHVSLIQFFCPPLSPPSLFSLLCRLSSQEKKSAALIVISDGNSVTVGSDIYAGLSLQMVERWLRRRERGRVTWWQVGRVKDMGYYEQMSPK